MNYLLQKYIGHIESSFEKAQQGRSKITDDIIRLEGMTGTYTRHFYNNMLNVDWARYLEIGVWKGSSVCSAMYGNKADVICIDNWSQFQGPKNEFVKNFNKFKGENNAAFIEEDCFSIDISQLPKFNIYLYDGKHTEEDHYRALEYYYDCMDQTFIFIVDDWNWDKVREGTYRAITDLKLKECYYKEVRLTNDGKFTKEISVARKTWHNGIYIGVLQK